MSWWLWEADSQPGGGLGSPHAPPGATTALVVRQLAAPTPAPPHASVPAQPASAAEPVIDPLPPAPPSASSAPFEAPAYWPRKLLDTGLTPLTPVILPSPEGSTPQPDGHAVLELFIHADGQVDRIEVIESSAPADFVDAAKATFMATPFTPGLKDNVPVPSRIKIEVRFEQR